MTAVTVTIGRDVAGAPMRRDRWRTFRADVRQAFATVGADMWVDASYRGRWDGRYEDAHVIVAGLPDDAPVDVLRETVRGIGAAYGQESVGWLLAPEPALLATGEVTTAAA
jgi:hypothetical protein